MVRERNAQWLKTLPDLLQRGGTFVLVGVAHLPGPDGLVAGLRARGFSIESIELPAGTGCEHDSEKSDRGRWDYVIERVACALARCAAIGRVVEGIVPWCDRTAAQSRARQMHLCNFCRNPHHFHDILSVGADR
ncbi:TraB/GumN family protein [Burkholderia stagnalis]